MSDQDLIECGVCKKHYENNIDLFAVVNFYYPICNSCYQDKGAIKEYVAWESEIDRLLNENVG